MLTSSMGRAYLAVQEPDKRAALLGELATAAGKDGEDGARLVKAAQEAIEITPAMAAVIRFATGMTT